MHKAAGSMVITHLTLVCQCKLVYVYVYKKDPIIMYSEIWKPSTVSTKFAVTDMCILVLTCINSLVNIGRQVCMRSITEWWSFCVLTQADIIDGLVVWHCPLDRCKSCSFMWTWNGNIGICRHMHISCVSAPPPFPTETSVKG